MQNFSCWLRWFLAEIKGTKNPCLWEWSLLQDTLVCYEALAQYAIRESNRDIYQMEVTLESTASTNWQEVVRLNMTNFDVLYSSQVREWESQIV